MATTYEVTCFERFECEILEIGTFDFRVESIAVGTLLDEMIVTAVRWVNPESGMAEVEVEFA
jgi:hypothetical protein